MPQNSQQPPMGRNIAQLQRAQDVISAAILREPPFEFVNRDIEWLESQTVAYLTGALDALHFALGNDEPPDLDDYAPNPDAKLDWIQLGIPASLENAIAMLEDAAKAAGFEVREMPRNIPPNERNGDEDL